MALHAVWVHGTSVRPQWVGPNLKKVEGFRWDGSIGEVDGTEINGLPQGWGTTFRANRSLVVGPGGALATGPFDVENPFLSGSQKGYWFHFPIPAPVVVAGRRSTLLRVFLFWETRGRVAPVAIHVYDGLQRIDALPVDASVPGLLGREGLEDLKEGITMFTLRTPHEMFWSLGLSIGVSFFEDGEVTFVAAGADFDV